MSSSQTNPDTSILKEGRKRCWQARDAFFQCVADAGVVFSLDAPVPAACARQRAAYEASCKASWVRHFDTAHDKELRILKTLRSNINKSAATASGVQAGTDLRQETTPEK